MASLVLAGVLAACALCIGCAGVPAAPWRPAANPASEMPGPTAPPDRHTVQPPLPARSSLRGSFRVRERRAASEEPAGHALVLGAAAGWWVFDRALRMQDAPGMHLEMQLPLGGGWAGCVGWSWTQTQAEVRLPIRHDAQEPLAGESWRRRTATLWAVEGSLCARLQLPLATELELLAGAGAGMSRFDLTGEHTSAFHLLGIAGVSYRIGAVRLEAIDRLRLPWTDRGGGGRTVRPYDEVALGVAVGF
ncbi:MAG: hypothetical protein KatS3mg102_0389 [Planctomycetota bacterium]|nr:MAG: hypothetical protein KatS3mg102_0389 [Planctomycetota bacterium]